MEKEILIVEDKSRIERVIFKHPELMSSNAESLIREKYNRLLGIRNSLSDARLNVRIYEEELKEAEKEWDSISKMVTLTHPSRQKEYHTEKCSFGIRGHGNDIIGKTSVV